MPGMLFFAFSKQNQCRASCNCKAWVAWGRAVRPFRTEKMRTAPRSKALHQGRCAVLPETVVGSLLLLNAAILELCKGDGWGGTRCLCAFMIFYQTIVQCAHRPGTSTLFIEAELGDAAIPALFPNISRFQIYGHERSLTLQNLHHVFDLAPPSKLKSYLCRLKG